MIRIVKDWDGHKSIQLTVTLEEAIAHALGTEDRAAKQILEAVEIAAASVWPTDEG